MYWAGDKLLADRVKLLADRVRAQSKLYAGRGLHRAGALAGRADDSPIAGPRVDPPRRSPHPPGPTPLTQPRLFIALPGCLSPSSPPPPVYVKLGDAQLIY